jgi:hypothetical protein
MTRSIWGATSNAEICRIRRWTPGTVFRIEDETGAALFCITAIGDDGVLAKQIASMEFGFGWSEFKNPTEVVIGFGMHGAKKGRGR